MDTRARTARPSIGNPKQKPVVYRAALEEVKFWPSFRSPETHRVLDFGCGYGQARPWFEAAGWEWTGVDLYQRSEGILNPGDLNRYEGWKLLLFSNVFNVQETRAQIEQLVKTALAASVMDATWVLNYPDQPRRLPFLDAMRALVGAVHLMARDDIDLRVILPGTAYTQNLRRLIYNDKS